MWKVYKSNHLTFALHKQLNYHKMKTHSVLFPLLGIFALAACKPNGNNNNQRQPLSRHTADAESQFPDYVDQSGITDDGFSSKIQSFYSVEDDNLLITPTTAAITIMVVGRSGSEITATIKELVGPNTNFQLPDRPDTFKNIMEYTLTNVDSSNNYTIKLVDIPGFIDGRSSVENSEILSSMKYYILQNGYPDYFLAVSRFDDNRFEGEHSSFIQFLKQLEFFQKIHNNGTSPNTVFLLTNLMSSGRGPQRKPERKLNQFKAAIESYTSFPNPITVVVGQNDAVNQNGLGMVDGYTKLPNKELYPKNVWQALINVTQEFSINKQVLTAVMTNREREMSLEQTLIYTDWEYFNDDRNDYFYIFQQENIGVDDNDVNTRIQDVYETFSEQNRSEYVVQILAFQLRLQNMNITDLEDLPETPAEKAALFQTEGFSSGIAPILLLEAFELKPAEYNKGINVGFGYDLLKGEILSQTPFKPNKFISSPVGYEIPENIKCKKLFQNDIISYNSFSQSIFDYYQERLNYLEFPEKENMRQCFFDFEPKQGFNLKPKDNAENINLSLVKEIHTLKCEINPEHLELNENFLAAVNSLSEFDSANISSVIEWQIFFDTFGSHVVTQSYGGGSMNSELTIEIPKLSGSSETDGDFEAVFYSMAEFTTFAEGDEVSNPLYRLYGGNVSSTQVEKLLDLSEKERNVLLNEWEKSLETDFVILGNKLGLEPISKFIQVFDEEKGKQVEKAIELLLNGKLKYSSRHVSPSNVNGAEEPAVSTAEALTTTLNSNVSKADNISKTGNSEEGYSVELISKIYIPRNETSKGRNTPLSWELVEAKMRKNFERHQSQPQTNGGAYTVRVFNQTYHQSERRRSVTHSYVNNISRKNETRPRVH